DTILKAADILEKDLAEAARRTVALKRMTLPPPGPYGFHDGDTLRDFEARMSPEHRRDFIRQFVDRIIIHPPGQGSRRLGASVIEVIPGKWADGLDREITGCAPVIPARMVKAREAVTGYLAGHPWQTAKDVAGAVGRSWAFA